MRRNRITYICKYLFSSLLFKIIYNLYNSLKSYFFFYHYSLIMNETFIVLISKTIYPPFPSHSQKHRLHRRELKKKNKHIALLTLELVCDDAISLSPEY